MKFATLLEAIAHWAEQTPDAVCLIDANCDRKITYADFWRHIRIFARRLCAMGLQKGDRVVVRVGPLIETFVAQFGIYLAGGVYCPVEKHLKELKIIEMLDYFDAKLLVSSEAVTFNGQWLALPCALDDGEPLESIAFPCPEDMCAIVFTTGTTGKAKGVMLAYNAALAAAKTWSALFSITKDDIFFCLNPMDRAAGVRFLCFPFLAGGTLVHKTGIVFIDEFFNTIAKYHITGMNIQSTVFDIIMSISSDYFLQYKDQIRFIIFSSGSMTEKQIDHICSLLPDTKLYMQYGSTEITSITKYEFSAYPYKANCVGKPYDGTKIYLQDQEGRPMKAASSGDMGMITCRNNTMMLGYWKDPELTKTVMINGYIAMTDMGYIDGDGYLYLIGRSDDVIVSGGYKIAPYEIENIVSQMPGIAECVCVPQQNSILGAVPSLFVVMKEDTKFSAKDISQYLAERIESQKMPRIIRELDEMPRVHGSLKINRKKLRA